MKATKGRPDAGCHTPNHNNSPSQIGDASVGRPLALTQVTQVTHTDPVVDKVFLLVGALLGTLGEAPVAQDFV